MQGALFPVESDWAPPKEFPNIGECDVGLDTECQDSLFDTRGPGWCFEVSREIRGGTVGVSLAAGDARWYFPFGHQDGGNLDRENVLRFVGDTLKRARRVFMHNAAYDSGWLTAEGVDVDYSKVHDTQQMAAMCDENRYRYDLDSCMGTWLGPGSTKDESLLLEAGRMYLSGGRGRARRPTKDDIKGKLWQFHSKYVGPYAEQDAWGPLALGRVLMAQMEKDDVLRSYEIERRFIPLLILMRRRGVRVDLDRADQVKAIFKQRESDAISSIRAQTGYTVRAGVPSQDAAQVLKHVGLSPPVTAKGNESVTASWLESLDHPIAKTIVLARKNNKAWRDFIDGQIFEYQVNGRIHASFHPLRSDEGGTVTGRFSCTDPNLQQVPTRDPTIGPLVRSCYVGEEGEKWCAPDYSSQEPRWTIHLGAAIREASAIKVANEFWRNPRTDFHGLMTQICYPDLEPGSAPFKAKRRDAKDIFLGMCYGMGGAKLCRKLGLPTKLWYPDGERGKAVEVAGDAGREIIKRFNDMVPFVKKLGEEAAKAAEQRGFVRTFFGRKCRLDGFYHKSLNRIVQGSAAEQAKVATLRVWEELGKVPLLLVHDENGYSVSDSVEATNICELMETAVEGVNCPFVVEPKVAHSWGECKE